MQQRHACERDPQWQQAAMHVYARVCMHAGIAADGLQHHTRLLPPPLSLLSRAIQAPLLLLPPPLLPLRWYN